MPVIKSAIKKWRKDKKRTALNNTFREKLQFAIKKAKKGNTQKTLTEAFSVIDKAAKKNLIHKNKAARLKSSLARNLPEVTQSTSAKKLPSTLRSSTHKSGATRTKAPPKHTKTQSA